MQIYSNLKFERPIEIIEAFDNQGFIQAFYKIENIRKLPNYYLLGYIRYEAKEIFLGNKIKSNCPLLYFEVFLASSVKSTQKLFSYLKNGSPYHCENDLKEIISCKSLIDYETYKKAIEEIKLEIANGNTYQVNYTYDYKVEVTSDRVNGLDLYSSILPSQITPYNFYMKNEYEEILSFSPELFFELKNNVIKTKPMKGTVQRGRSLKEDKRNIEFLKNDIKNRAENVMIVDLLRNDLGKIAKTGSVKVDKLFEVETHKTVHQMTSEVFAEIDEQISLFDIFEAIFPCGSITGTPKINTMEIIDKLEVGSRDVYCGAIGFISPERTVFSVPIRILQRKSREENFYCRVGGAIVWDSTPEDEWHETLTKISFLQPTLHKMKFTPFYKDCEDLKQLSFFIDDSDSSFQQSYNKLGIKLVETILVKKGKMQFAFEHLKRMKQSAEKLGVGFSFMDSFNSILNSFQDCKSGFHWCDSDFEDYIFRILLSLDGVFEKQCLPLESINTNRVVVSKTTVQSDEIFLKHKTTYRPWYEKSMEQIKKGLIFDEIYFNEKKELTEGSRSNVVLQIDGELFTPPCSCGLLNGVLRQKMLDESNLKERILYLSDLQKAEKVFCINSVRGITEVEFEK